MKDKRTKTFIALLLTLTCVTAYGQNEAVRLRGDNIRLRLKIDSLERVIAQSSFGLGAEDERAPFSPALTAAWDAMAETAGRNDYKPLRQVDTLLLVPVDECVDGYVSLYTGARKDNFRKILRRYDLYRDMMRSAFARENVPEELTLLSIVESACNPRAVSRAGAAGMWQLMEATARDLGLRVEGYEDDRFDVKKSTRAAAAYLAQLYSSFGSWSLAVFAYNCGERRVRQAIDACNGELTYRNIYDHLPRETREYLPALVAAMWAYANRELIYDDNQ